MPGPKKNFRGTIRDRLLALSVIDPVTQCWNWIGATIVSGSGLRYGAIKVDGKRELAHRVSFLEFKGRKLPRNHVGAHRCDNSLCVNPDHIRPGTQKSNIRESVARGRHRWSHSKRSDLFRGE